MPASWEGDPSTFSQVGQPQLARCEAPLAAGPLPCPCCPLPTAATTQPVLSRSINACCPMSHCSGRPFPAATDAATVPCPHPSCSFIKADREEPHTPTRGGSYDRQDDRGSGRRDDRGGAAGTTGTIAGLTEEAITMTARASRGEEEVQDAGTISGTTVGAGRVMIMVSMCSYCCRLHRQATCLRGCSA